MCVCVCVFVCSLRYPACKAHSQYCRLWPVRLYRIFPHYLINRTIIEKKVIEHKMCSDFIWNLFKTFVILRRIRRDVTMNVHRSSCKLTFILSDFNENSIFSTDFRKYLKYQISLKCIQWEPSCSFRMGRQTYRRADRNDEAIVAFRSFVNAPTSSGADFVLVLGFEYWYLVCSLIKRILIFCCMPSGFLLRTD